MTYIFFRYNFSVLNRVLANPTDKSLKTWKKTDTITVLVWASCVKEMLNCRGSYRFMSLTKTHIVKKIQDYLGYSQKDATEVLETLLEIMKQTLENGEDVLISGFGKFCVKDKKQRKGRNPATNTEMVLPERRVTTFRCSRKLRDLVNGDS